MLLDKSMTSSEVVKIKQEEGDYWIKITFELTRNIHPLELKDIVNKFPEVKGNKILLLSGRAPIWMYGSLVHKYAHLVQAVGIYDPKINGYVIVATHSNEVSTGDIVFL